MTYPDRNRVALLGYIEATLWEAPFDDWSWRRENGDEIWGLNDLWRKSQNSLLVEHASSWQAPLQARYIRYDRWFEMHARGKSSKDEIDWLKRCGCSVYMLKHHDDIPQSIAFPIAEARAHFGVNYFTNTFSYELALAIMEGFREIHLYGIDMAAIDNEGPPELRDQRASIEFFLGWAMATGIKVIIPEASDILKTALLYGYDEHADSAGQKVRRMREAYHKKASEYRELARYYDGAEAAAGLLERTWGDAGVGEEDG